MSRVTLAILQITLRHFAGVRSEWDYSCLPFARHFCNLLSPVTRARAPLDDKNGYPQTFYLAIFQKITKNLIIRVSRVRRTLFSFQVVNCPNGKQDAHEKSIEIFYSRHRRIWMRAKENNFKNRITIGKRPSLSRISNRTCELQIIPRRDLSVPSRLSSPGAIIFPIYSICGKHRHLSQCINMKHRETYIMLVIDDRLTLQF